MNISLRHPLTRVLGGLAGLAASGAALAHPGHGADVFHQHGDWLLGLLALCAVGGLVWHLARRRDGAPRD
jgi:hypothetical protein